MSQSHLNLSADSTEPPYMNEDDTNIRRAIYEDKMTEHFDYSTFKNTDDITKVPGIRVGNPRTGSQAK